MKTKAKKAANQKRNGQEATKAFELARRKFITAWEKVDRLRNSPAVMRFLKMQEATEQQSSEQNERLTKRMHLSTSIDENVGFIKEQIVLFDALQTSDFDPPSLGFTFMEIENRLDKITKSNKEWFDLERRGKKEANSKKDIAA